MFIGFVQFDNIRVLQFLHNGDFIIQFEREVLGYVLQQDTFNCHLVIVGNTNVKK